MEILVIILFILPFAFIFLLRKYSKVKKELEIFRKGYYTKLQFDNLYSEYKKSSEQLVESGRQLEASTKRFNDYLSNVSRIGEASAMKGEIERLNTIVDSYKDSGALSSTEAWRFKNDNSILFSNYNDLKHKFEKMEQWHGSYYSNYTKSIGDFLSGENTTRESEPIKVEKVLKAKFKPSDLTYKQLEACTNYFVENQHELKSKV